MLLLYSMSIKSVILLIYDNSCPVLIACVARLDLCVWFLKSVKCSELGFLFFEALLL